MELSILEYEEKDAVAVITMRHPPVNALGVNFLTDLETVLEQLGQRTVRAAVITSACPGFFSAGDNIASLAEIDEALLAKLPRAHAALDAFSRSASGHDASVGRYSTVAPACRTRSVTTASPRNRPGQPGPRPTLVKA